MSGSSPETLLDHRPPDHLDLRARLELFPVQVRGGLMHLAFENGLAFMKYAEAVEETLWARRFRNLGYRNAATFVQRHLGQTMNEVDRLIDIARRAEQLHWVDLDEDEDPPIGALKALFHIKSTRPWVSWTRSSLLSLLADGSISVRSLKMAVRRSVTRAGKTAKHTPRRNRPPGQRARMQVRLKDGRTIVVKDGGLNLREHSRGTGPKSSKYKIVEGR